tara:strand:+ start:4516 stop:4629 length:114 start_codon:yes stop_codon:yes gene_type:complete
MTEDDKKTYIWTVGLVGALVIIMAIAFATGLIPTTVS